MFVQWIKSQHPYICLMFVLVNCTSKLQHVDVIIQRPFKHAFKKQFHMWTFCTIKDQLLKEKDPKVDFHMWLTIKLKFCGWLFHAWTHVCGKIKIWSTKAKEDRFILELHPKFLDGSIRSQFYQILIIIRFDKRGRNWKSK